LILRKRFMITPTNCFECSSDDFDIAGNKHTDF
jgi:hypothetical protein